MNIFKLEPDSSQYWPLTHEIYLVNLPEEKSHRNQSLLNTAAEIIHL